MNRFGFSYKASLTNAMDRLQNNYKVQKGDTLYAISKKYNIPVEVLIEGNSLSSTTIYPDQVIVIPMKINDGGMYFEEYVIKPNDTLDKIANKLNVPTDLIGRYNDITKLYLDINQVLKIPSIYNTYEIAEDDSLLTILNKTNMTAEELIEANKDVWLVPYKVINVK